MTDMGKRSLFAIPVRDGSWSHYVRVMNAHHLFRVKEIILSNIAQRLVTIMPVSGYTSNHSIKATWFITRPTKVDFLFEIFYPAQLQLAPPY
jgi:hypothetical protein